MTQANQTTERDEWWDQVVETFVQDIPFEAEFDGAEGTITTTED
jgi:hypothetical protein